MARQINSLDALDADFISDVMERSSSGNRNAFWNYLTPRQWAAKIKETLTDASVPASIRSSDLLSQVGWAMERIMTSPDFKPGPPHDRLGVADRPLPTPEQISKMSNSQKIESLIATSTASFKTGGGGQGNV